METLKEWWKLILGALVFLGAMIFAVRDRKGTSSTLPDNIPADVVNKQQEEKLQENKTSIEASQNAAVQAAKPVTKTEEKDIDSVIDKWNKS